MRLLLMFIVLQDFFASNGTHRVLIKKLLPKRTVHYSFHLKLNNMAQRKTTNIEKQFYQ